MSQQVLVERMFERLISGDRSGAREIVDQCLSADAPAEAIIEKLFWPAYEMVQKLFRNDQMSVIAHHYATRLLRMLVDQMQLRLTQQDRTGRKVLLLCGPREGDELAGQLAADMLEAAGNTVYFGGGGIANDEVIGQIGELRPAVLVLFGSAPSDLPAIRQLVDELHDMSVCPEMQVVVGGGVFNRAEGLSEEIGADLWAETPTELVKAVEGQQTRRMAGDQRTVGRRRRTAKVVAA